jgi:hypothetical protein
MASLLKRNMRLFGIPYQFHSSVDPRIPSVSTTVGRKFAENIVLDAPVITIIPGKPVYLPGVKDKVSVSQALLDAANDMFHPIQSIMEQVSNLGDEEIKYYDFESSYREYIQYVNILCRTCASFLEIKEKIDGETCQQYDYSKYKWNTDFDKGSSLLEKTYNNITNSVNVTTTDTSNDPHAFKFETDMVAGADDLLTNYNHVQFFIDAQSVDESISNAVGESQIKGALTSASNIFKELAFVTGSAGIGDLGNSLTDLATSAGDSVRALFGTASSNSDIAGALDRVIKLTGNIAKGENIIMPQVYQDSSYDKSYSFTVHLKSPYGTKFGYFMDICVPLMFLIGLGLPKQTTANTYGSPFLIKAYCEGMFTCNMGMVTSMTISKGVNNAFTVDGLPTEVDVTVSITDLYSDLSMTPQSSPMGFIQNSSLVEYLATTCGLSLISPNLQSRLDMIANTVTNAFTDVPENIFAGISEKIDNYVKDFLQLKDWR